MAPIRNLILVLGDQLTPTLTSLAAGDPARDRVLMEELADEASYVRHHRKKIAFLFSAMRHFAAELRGLGWTVDYVTVDDPDNRGSFTEQFGAAIARQRPERVVVTEAGEWRVRQMQESWAARFSLPVDILPDERFLCLIAWFARRAQGAALAHVDGRLGTARTCQRRALPGVRRVVLGHRVGPGDGWSHDGAMTRSAHHPEHLGRILLRRESLAAVRPGLSTGSGGPAV